MRCFVPSGALALSLLLAEAAAAQTRALRGSGAWAAYGGLAQDGQAVCGMRGSGSEGRNLHMRWFAGDDGLTVQAFKPSWNIPRGTSLPLVIDVDGRANWRVTEAWGGGTLVDWRVSQRTFDEFVPAFRAGNTLTVTFPGGSEAPWVASLRASMATFDLFARCILAVDGPPDAAAWADRGRGAIGVGAV